MEFPRFIAKFCKSLLRAYPLFKEQLEQVKKEAEETSEALSAKTLLLPHKGGALTDPTAITAIRVARLNAIAKILEFYVKSIDLLLQHLSPDLKKFVELAYFQERPWRYICRECGLAESTAYRVQARIIRLCAHFVGLWPLDPAGD